MSRLVRYGILFLLLAGLLPLPLLAQDTIPHLQESILETDTNIHTAIKTKFIEGSAFFMSFIALALIIGLTFCLERIIYLNLVQINTKKFLARIDQKLNDSGSEEAMALAQDTKGPVASICYQALNRIEEDIDMIDRSITTTGGVQINRLEKNLSWITLFIAIAPSLGFLGTVIGMIQAFDNIQQQGDISPTIVAEGMKLALITTVGGLIVAIILQLFYNYILSKIEEIVGGMEEDSMTILDIIIRYKRKNKK